MDNIIEELKKLAQDLYNEGYYGGGDGEDLLKAWAITMKKVADGEKYTDELFDNIYLNKETGE
jgi:hypothetical protein